MLHFARLWLMGAAALLLMAPAHAQIPDQAAGGVDALKAGAKRDIAYTKARTTEPGGTPESKLWQVLILFGVGDTQPSSWQGTVSVTAGDVHSLEGFRFELPDDRIFPRGRVEAGA